VAKQGLSELPEGFVLDKPDTSQGLLELPEEFVLDAATPDTPPWYGITPIREDIGLTLGEPRTRGEAEKEEFNHQNTIKLSNETRMPYGLVRDNYSGLTEHQKFLQSFTDDGFDIRVGLGETVQRMDALDYANRFIPFFPGKAIEMIGLQGAVSRLQEDNYSELKVPVGHITEEPQSPQKMRDSDVKMVEDYFAWQEELSFRGHTWGAKAFIGMTHLPKWMMEFMLTGGLQQLGSESAKNTAVHILRRYTQSPGGRTTLRAAGWVGGAITRASLGLTHRVIEETFERKLPKQVKFGPNDEFTIQVKGENWASSVVKGWADVVIEAASEEAGAEISKHLMGLMRKMPFGKKIIDGIFTAWFEKNQTGTVAQFYNEFFTKAGYSNIIGEIGEERLSTILRAVLHTESFGLPDDSKVFDRLSAGLSADLQNFPIEALVLGVPGATRYVGGRIISKFNNPTMEVVNRYNPKIKAAQKRGDTDAVESLKLMEQYELAQLAKPVFTAFQEAERAKPIEVKEEPVVKEPAEPVEGEEPEAVEVAPEAKKELITEEKQLRGAINKNMGDAINTLFKIWPTIGKELGISRNELVDRGAAFVFDTVSDVRKGLRAKGRRDVSNKFDAVEAEHIRLVAKLDINQAKLGDIEAQPVEKPEVAEPIDQDDFNQSMLDDGATESFQASRGYLGVDQPKDIELEDPTEEDIGFIRDIFHKIGYKEKSGYEPLSEKDYRSIYRFLQMPLDVKHSFPQFGPVFDVQRSAEVTKSILDNRFAEDTLPYFSLHHTARAKVDAALLEAERNPALVYGPKRLKELGLNKAQMESFLAVRNALDLSKQLLLQKMRANDVSEKVIEDFSKNVMNYIPHKWYGRWANVVKDKEGKVLFMSKTNYTDRFKERDRLKKLYPDTHVTTMKSNTLPRELFDQAPAHAVFQVLDKITKEAEINEDTKAIIQEALADFYKSKGFASHYIRRKNIPGFTEDLHRPLAEYFRGLTSYLVMIDKVKAFPEALSAIDGAKTPKLYSYAANYIKYVLGEQQEFAPAKQAAYYYYLYGNIKSAAMNATQNFILGWPELSKRTNFSLAYMLQALPRTAGGRLTLTAKEQKMLADMEARGYLEPQLSMEVSGYAGKPMYTTFTAKGRKVLNLFDVFRHMEKFNRRAMAVALYDSGITDLEEINEHVLAAHFLYGKGNRPTLMRGPISPLMTFRSFGINYITWVKNEVKAKRVAPLARSTFALALFGGLSALPGFEAIKWFWRKTFGTDLEGEAREALGEQVGRTLFRGAPAAGLGISFTGAVSPVEIPTNLKELGGVFADQGQRAFNVYRDLRIKDYRRALEEASPEIIRNPLAAYRMYTQGIRTRSGEAIVDIQTGEPLKATPGEAARKAVGFQPTRMAEQWDINQFIRNKTKERTNRKQLWTDTFFLAYLNKDLGGMKQVISDINTHNEGMIKRKRENDIIPISELDEMLKNRMGIANVPQRSMLNALIEIRKQYYD
jgi:hypothetical protein